MNEELLEYKLNQVEAKLSLISTAVDRIAEAMTTLAIIEAHQKMQYKTIDDLTKRVGALEEDVQELRSELDSNSWLYSLTQGLLGKVITAVVFMVLGGVGIKFLG